MLIVSEYLKVLTDCRLSVNNKKWLFSLKMIFGKLAMEGLTRADVKTNNYPLKRSLKREWYF